MSSVMADQGKRGNEFRSPVRVLASFFRKSRDQWKRKYVDAKTELKRFKVRVSDVSKSRDAWKEASSPEFVGELWLGKVGKCVIEGDFDGLVGAKAIGFSDRQFRFVVETLDRPGGNGPFGPEPIEN